ncbi:MAG: amidase domain-containing protein [Clostridium sp.]
MKKVALFLIVIIMSGGVMSNGVGANQFDEISDVSLKEVKAHVNDVYVNLNERDKTILVKELYDSKTNKENIEKVQLQMDLEEVDEALERVNREEEYVVNLIKELGEETTIGKWEFNLEYLKKNYSKIKKEENVNIQHVESYINAYELVKEIENLPEEKKADSKERAITKPTYNRSAATTYAGRYAESYNKNYPDWNRYGGDCANFISQVVYAGGRPMSSEWKSSGTACNTSKVTSAWRGAQEFRNYWQRKAKSYKTFTKVDSSSYSYGHTGDAIAFINSNGRATHIMTIYKYSNPDFILAGHTADTKNQSLKSKAANYSKFIIFNMDF